ncbi:tetratricopeptide repeat protein [Flavobacterium paronense]|uniref:Tetratricopeptide repeat protein n=1 Tax=Flavobacterium paronense TaxID=1392775 RepID=A0ABV5GF62_9FLAO|nr:tetratricopeptide repeat protein [Flavobacterium paronense]MDN3678589.1 tetratricopeptide repeat protein [Flavobacterium paronense]
MNKRLIYWIIVLLVSLYSCTPKTVDKEVQAKNDSIKMYLDLAGNDTLDLKLRNKYNSKAFSLVNLNKNDTLTRFYINSVSYNYLDTNDWVDFKKTEKIHFEKSIAVKDTLNLARYYRYKGGYFRKNTIYDSAYYYYIKSEKFYKKTSDKYGLAKVYQYKSIVQFNKDDYLGADLSAEKAYDYFKRTNSIEDQFQLLICIGNSAHNLKNYKKAIKTFNLAILIAKKYKLKKSGIDRIATCLNNIGNVYREQKKYSKAMQYFNLALKEKKLIKKDPVIYGFLLNNLSYCKLQLKDYSGFPDLLFKSIELLNSRDEGIRESTVSYVYLSNYYYAINNTLKAQLYAEKALKIAKKFKSPYYYLTALSNAGSVNVKKAPQYIKEYHEKNDSLLFIERNARNQYYKIQLETDEISQEKETAIKQKWIIGTIAGVLVIIIALLLIINKQRAKQKELQFQQSQQKANEEIYHLMLTQKSKEDKAKQTEKKRIARELHDGIMNRLSSTRLNLSILSNKTDKETIQKCLTYINEINQIETEIRTISHDLNQDVFQKEDSYIKMVKDFVSEQNKTSKTHYELEIDNHIDWNSVSSEIKMHLYRIIQEASYNIYKYAQAKKATISLVLDAPNICMAITDNGIGFDTTIISKGIGIQNMQARVKSLNGKFSISSKKLTNTSINIAIPIK